MLATSPSQAAKPGGGSSGSCDGVTAPPSMAFHRAGSSGRDLYLADAGGACQKRIVNLPAAIADASLSMRIVPVSGQSVARIIVIDATAVKMIEVPIINGMRTLGAATVYTILPRSTSGANRDDFVDNTFFELAADGLQLAYVAIRNWQDGLTSASYELRVLRDVTACRNGCTLDAGDLLARRVQVPLNQRLATPRWGRDAARIYLMVHNGAESEPDIAWVPAAETTTPWNPMANPVVLAGGHMNTLFAVQPLGAGEALAYGEATRLARGYSCRHLRVIDPATGARLNADRQYAKWADLEAADPGRLSLLTIPGKADNNGYCSYANTTVNRLVDNAGVTTNAAVASGTWPSSAQ
jgi:hypothetical protein